MFKVRMTLLGSDGLGDIMGIWVFNLGRGEIIMSPVTQM